ncbi:MAG: hypothetical protein LBF22_11350 [Deltaproteobacteria bacterium]|nr:hypothetical protein [Deltaproteobacteria bacterium]
MRNRLFPIGILILSLLFPSLGYSSYPGSYQRTLNCCQEPIFSAPESQLKNPHRLLHKNHPQSHPQNHRNDLPQNFVAAETEAFFLVIPTTKLSFVQSQSHLQTQFSKNHCETHQSDSPSLSQKNHQNYSVHLSRQIQPNQLPKETLKTKNYSPLSAPLSSRLSLVTEIPKSVTIREFSRALDALSPFTSATNPPAFQLSHLGNPLSRPSQNPDNTCSHSSACGTFNCPHSPAAFQLSVSSLDLIGQFRKQVFPFAQFLSSPKAKPLFRPPRL